MMVRRILAAAALLATAVPLALADPGRIKLGEFIPASPPQPAPQLALTDMQGKPVALADFAGKFILANLWATWCQPCLKEMPELEQLQASLGPALTIVAISEDRGGAKVVEPFIAKLGLDKVAVLLDPGGEATRVFGVRGLPTTLFIDGDGKVVGRVEGAAAWSSAEMLGVVKALLPEEAPGDAAKRAAR
jgi:thiol-disulfide isomerase/thioredoxin